MAPPDKRVKLHDLRCFRGDQTLVDGTGALTRLQDTLNASRDVMALVIDDPLRELKRGLSGPA